MAPPLFYLKNTSPFTQLNFRELFTHNFSACGQGDFQDSARVDLPKQTMKKKIQLNIPEKVRSKLGCITAVSQAERERIVAPNSYFNDALWGYRPEETHLRSHTES